MIKTFIKVVTDHINTIYNCYYDEASSDAELPFVVLNGLNTSSLDAGFQTDFDIYIMNSEFTKINNEEIQDKIRKLLDGFFFNNQKTGFHVKFDNQQNIRDVESDLIICKMSFIARHFEK